jgi:hypothetical protein
MKPVFYVVAALALGGCAAHMEPASAPPVKMGLWELTIDPSKAIVDSRLEAEVPRMTEIRVKQLCVTPETWRNLLAGRTLESIAPGCDVQNLKQDASALSYDWVCNGLREPPHHGHSWLVFRNPETVRITDHLEFSDATRPGTWDMSYDAVYQGADCKGIAPGSFKMKPQP